MTALDMGCGGAGPDEEEWSCGCSCCVMGLGGAVLSMVTVGGGGVLRRVMMSAAVRLMLVSEEDVVTGFGDIDAGIAEGRAPCTAILGATGTCVCAACVVGMNVKTSDSLVVFAVCVGSRDFGETPFPAGIPDMTGMVTIRMLA